MRRWLPTLLLALLAALPARAENSPMPVLGEHAFVPIMTIEEPFLTAHVETSVKIGRAVNTDTPSLSIGDSTAFVGAPAEQVYTGLAFTYQHRMKDWLAVRARINAAGRLGTNTRTLVTDGITGSVGYDLGWKLRVIRTESVIVSGSVKLSNNSATFINVLQWANDLVDGKDATLTRGQSSLRGAAGLHAAWGINERFGVLGSIWGDFGESFSGAGDNAWVGDARFGLSYDLETDLRVPLGLGVAAGIVGFQEIENSSAWFWSARLALQTRQDFSIGFDVGTSYYENAFHGGDAQFTRLSIDTRYYY